MICPTVADGNAPEHAGSYDDELALLVVHGVLHLLGMTTPRPTSATACRPRAGDCWQRTTARLADDPWRRRDARRDQQTPTWRCSSSIVVLLFIAMFLALAETALTRMTRGRRPQALAEDGRRHRRHDLLRAGRRTPSGS